MASVLQLRALVEELRQQRALVTPEDLELRRRGRFCSGLPLDELLGGGFPLGRMVELTGTRGALGTAIAWALLARATTEGFASALVDYADAFEPHSAADGGVQLERLLWCRPPTLKTAARSTDVLLASKAFSLVVLDLGFNRGGELPFATWARLARRAEMASILLVVLAHFRGLGTFAAASLRASCLRAQFQGRGPGRTFDQLRVRFALTRNKLGLPPGAVDVSLRAPRHVVSPPERSQPERKAR